VGPNRPYGALLTYLVKNGSDSAKVAFSVHGATGDTIRRFEGPAKPGLNRAAWDLRHDGPRRPGSDDTPTAFLPPGPPALPGTYTVHAKLTDHDASATATFTADPRFQISVADRRAKQQILLRAGQRQNVSTEAIERLNSAEKATDRVLEQVGKRTDSTSKALAQAATDLKKRITETKETFLGPQGRQGISRDPDAVSALVGSAYGSLASSWDAPTEAQLIEWRQAEAALSRGLDAVNRLLTGDVAAFRQLAGARLLDVFPAIDALSLDWRKP
jgi:hypothetical protein